MAAVLTLPLALREKRTRAVERVEFTATLAWTQATPCRARRTASLPSPAQAAPNAARPAPLGRLANTRFAYVRSFELHDELLPHCWVVVRIDGKGFTKFTDAHGFAKPVDERGIHLMNQAAQAVLEELSDVVLAYGNSDEFSFVLRKQSTLYDRRASKLTSVIVSLFAATYVMHWREHFPDTALQRAPAFDARAVCYPSDETLRDYLSWRQADCHINCQYNSAFWGLVANGVTREEAQKRLAGTQTEAKNEILFAECGINYSQLPPMHRRGTILLRHREREVVKQTPDGMEVVRPRTRVVVLHDDLVGDSPFWRDHPQLLSS